MNDCAFLVLCGDKRQEYIFYSLQNKRLPVLSYMLDSFPKSKVSLYDLTKLCNIFICPTPFTKDDIYLHSTNKDSNKVLINDFLEMLEPNRPSPFKAVHDGVIVTLFHLGAPVGTQEKASVQSVGAYWSLIPWPFLPGPLIQPAERFSTCEML